MPVYLIMELTVIDQDAYGDYVARVPAVMEKYGGRYLVRSSQVSTLAGDWRPERIVVVEFDASEQVQDFYASPEFQELAPLRDQSISARIILVEGYEP